MISSNLFVPSLDFSSISHFLSYFQKKDALLIAQGQVFAIRDLSFLYKLHEEDPENLPSNALEKYLFVLNKILALTARCGVFKGEGTYSSLQVSPEKLSIQFTSDVTLQTSKGVINIRPFHLFQLMRGLGIADIPFEPDQILRFTDVTETDQTFEQPETLNLQKWASYAPVGSRIKWHIKEGLFSYSKGWIDGAYGIVQRQRFFSIQAPHGMTLSLSNVSIATSGSFSYPIVRLTQDMVLKGDFVFEDKTAIVLIDRNIVGPGRKLSIVARNVIMSPNSQLELGELSILTGGPSVILNVKADRADLRCEGDALLGNSSIRHCVVNSKKVTTVFGINQPHKIPLSDYHSAIFSALHEAFPGESEANHLLRSTHTLFLEGTTSPEEKNKKGEG